tara:strand:- start:3601 stop:3999 length:399 start_codon:yes stop_codon:yes gene_type:complete
MEEIDQYLQELNLQSKVDNFVKYGIKPIYPTFRKQIYPKITENDIPSIKIIKNEIKLPDMIQKCNEIEKELTELCNTNTNECPICYQSINNRSFITPTCGHKVCLNCYICCSEKRTTYSDNCCICRKSLLSM